MLIPEGVLTQYFSRFLCVSVERELDRRNLNEKSELLEAWMTAVEEAGKDASGVATVTH